MSEEKTNQVLTPTVFIAFSTAYAYFVVYSYEIGFCSEYNIPYYLIEISATNLLRIGLIMFGLFVSNLQLFGLSIPFFQYGKREDKKHLKPIVDLLGIVTIVSIIIFLVLPFTWYLVRNVILLTLLCIFIAWGPPFLMRVLQGKKFEDKLLDTYEESNRNDILSFLMSNLSVNERISIVALIAFPLISSFLGHTSITTNKEYQVLIGQPNTVVLKKYNDLFICSTFNRKTNILSDSIIVFKMSDSKPLLFKTEKIGVLMLK